MGKVVQTVTDKMLDVVCDGAIRAALGVSAPQIIRDVVIGYCKLAGVTPKTASSEALIRVRNYAAQYLARTEYAPTTKEGKAYTEHQLKTFARDACLKLTGAGKTKGAKQSKGKPAKPDAKSAPVADVTPPKPPATFPNSDVTPPKPPATFPNSDVMDKIRALCALCATSKDKNAKALATVVTAFFA